MGIQLKVCGVRGEVKIIHMCDTEEQLNSITVLQLKEKIKEEFGYQWQPSEFRLIYSYKELQDPNLLSQCGIRHMSTICVLLRLPSGGPLPAETREALQLATSSTDMVIQLEVRTVMGGVKLIHMCDTEEQFNSITVLQLKEKIKEEFGYQCKPPELRIIYRGKDLRENALLSQYGITHMSTIHVILRPPPGGSLPAKTREALELATSSTDMGILLRVYTVKGKVKIIHMCDTEEQLNSITVLQLKEKIVEEFGYQWQPSDLRILYGDMDLPEQDLLSQYGIGHMSIICVLERLRGGSGGWVFLPPVRGDGGMGDKDGKNRSMETLTFF